MEQIYQWIEVISARINLWAWKKKTKPVSESEWAKGYREWKKRKCPHNQPILQGFLMAKGVSSINNTGIVNVKIDLDDTKFGALPQKYR